MSTASSQSVLILMADDDADDRLLVHEALQEVQLDHALEFVADGEELLDYLYRRGNYHALPASRQPSLVLLDLNMPRKDGREALREIKAHPELRRIPVVVLTTSRADTDIAQVYQLGANSFIAKPVTFDALVRVMRVLKDYWIDTVELPALK